MAALQWAAVLFVAAGYYFALLAPPSEWSQQSPSAEAVAAAMLLMQKAAVDWCLGPSGCPAGPVPKAQLILPPAYMASGWIAAQAGGGRISTYVVGINLSPRVIAEKLNDLTQGGPSAGIVSATLTVTARDAGQPGRTPVAVAPGVPVGVPVVSQQVL